MLDYPGTIAHECAVNTVTPAATVNLIDRVQDVADTYLLTLQVYFKADKVHKMWRGLPIVQV